MIRLSVTIFQKYYVELVQFIIDNRLEDYYQLPVYLLQFAFQQKQKEQNGLMLPDGTTSYCILPNLVSEDQSHNLALAEFFDISQHAKIYEHLLLEIFNMTDSYNSNGKNFPD